MSYILRESQPSADYYISCQVPSHHVGAMVGRAGEVVRLAEEETAVKIEFGKEKPRAENPGDHRAAAERRPHDEAPDGCRVSGAAGAGGGPTTPAGR